MKDELNIGIIGAGGFAAFASKAFLKIPGIKIIAVTDVNEAVATVMANDMNAEVHRDSDKFFEDRRIDLVYIATPPFLHYEQSKKALLADKHVICEKPAALKTIEAEELSSLAKSLDLLYVVNLMQRYNPLFAIVKTIVEEKMLGNFLHGFFENYASDGNLKEDHWLWNETISGGIFIEHGIHFFDMFQGWFGDGKIINAVRLQRPGIKTKIFDRVQATVLYNGGIVNFYHAFDQPLMLEKQELRLQFERGEINLYEWIPVKLKLTGLLRKEHLKSIGKIMNDLSTIHHGEPSIADQKVQGRFIDIIYHDHVTIEYGNVLEKQNRYREMLTAMITDQWNWIKDRNHKRIIDDKNAVDSLRIAEQATKIANEF